MRAQRTRRPPLSFMEAVPGLDLVPGVPGTSAVPTHVQAGPKAARPVPRSMASVALTRTLTSDRMRLLKTLFIACALALALGSTATAQLYGSGAGSMIPTSGTGGGGTWDTMMPASPAFSNADVAVPVNGVGSIDVVGLNHSWVGDLQLTLSDPDGVEHNIFVRPGYLNTSPAGYSGNFLPGTYSFVQAGGTPLPTSTTSTPDLNPGVYNQSFDTGGTVWVSGTNGILNTPMSAIAGPAGVWTLRIYDWAGSDSGSFTGWSFGAGTTPGTAYCFGDGSGATCPCAAFGGAGEGCLNTSGVGAVLVGSGNSQISSDTFQLQVTGAAANKPGLFFQGTNQLSNPAGDGILCSNATLRYAVNPTDAGGSVLQSGFGVNALAGTSLNYQYWFRDTGNPCGGGFNFSNGWVQPWF